jgi:hypothetical protein
MADSTSSCVHHWILEQPEHFAVVGTCKKCGESRTYQDDEPRKMSWRERSVKRTA